MPRPHRGLPPYDPRNGVSFAPIPRLAWPAFREFEQFVFYVFARGDLLGMIGESTRLEVLCEGVFMCITPEMILFMRAAGEIPWWIRQHDLHDVYYSLAKEVGEPFLAFCTDPPARDVIFRPKPPAVGARAIAADDPRFDVKRTVRVLRDVGFAALDVRRAMRMGEVADPSPAAFIARLKREKDEDENEMEKKPTQTETEPRRTERKGSGRPLRAGGGGASTPARPPHPPPFEGAARGGVGGTSGGAAPSRGGRGASAFVASPEGGGVARGGDRIRGGGRGARSPPSPTEHPANGMSTTKSPQRDWLKQRRRGGGEVVVISFIHILFLFLFFRGGGGKGGGMRICLL
ncbi:unnamed protein product [Phytomonas sp. EM1]|nr:unnamed protein product [Phytomonas sp. EM1]|eukprot:CCW65430.1 unnamed protein product [Phytomonas sp. isolate EM1]